MIASKGKFIKTSVFLACLYSSIVFSAENNNSTNHFFLIRQARPVLSLFGGYANLHPANPQKSYIGTDDEIFIYQNTSQSNSSGVIGTFLGLEWQLPYHLTTQTGLEYDYFGTSHIKGRNNVGIQPNTSTPYTYRYRVQSQQLLAVAKLLYTTNKIYHPYALIGIGGAFNHSSGFNTTTSQTGSINLTPKFGANDQTAFSYMLGLGVDMDIGEGLRLGLAYRFSDFGHSSLGNGDIKFNNYQYPVTFSLNNSHLYANQVVLNLSYFI